MSYLVFSPDMSLRRLERPYRYDRRSDELYELSEEAWEFLESAGGPVPPPAESADPDFTGYLVEEGLATLADAPSDALGREICAPGELLARANHVLKDSLPAGRYVTVVVCRWSKDEKLEAASAGHPRPLRLEHGGAAEEVDLPSHLALGAAGDRPFATRTFHLCPSQTLLLYTDGVIESRQAGELFGVVGITNVWREARGRSLSEFTHTLCRESACFHERGRARDDRLALAARLVD